MVMGDAGRGVMRGGGSGNVDGLNEMYHRLQYTSGNRIKKLQTTQGKPWVAHTWRNAGPGADTQWAY